MGRLIRKSARGGKAIARSDDATAIGGDAGATVFEPGGRGGDATATTPGVTVVGGKGGRGGVQRGMDGMDVSDGPGGSIGKHIEGGMGGEAGQLDGRGGRGGLAPTPDELRELLGIPARPHMKRPYWGDDVIEYGRGSDAPDAPIYRARRLIIEMIKAQILRAQRYFTTEVWYYRDAEIVSRINQALERRGATWRVAIVDDEFEFTELDRRG